MAEELTLNSSIDREDLLALKELALSIIDDLEKNYSEELSVMKAQMKMTPDEWNNRASKGLGKYHERRTRFLAELDERFANIQPKVAHPLSFPTRDSIENSITEKEEDTDHHVNSWDMVVRDDLLYLEECIDSLWKMLRIARLLKDSSNDIKLSEITTNLKLGPEIKIESNKIKQFNDDTRCAVAAISFGEIALKGVSSRDIPIRIREGGLEVPLIEGFEDIQMRTLGTRFRVISTMSLSRLGS